MGFFNKNKEFIIHSPLRGVVFDLKDTDDDVFIGNIIGEGLAIKPTEGTIVAPVSCKVEIFKTNHLLIFEPSKGVYLVVHFGVGTSLLQGEGFKRLPGGQSKTVKVGDELILADLPYLEQHAKSLITPIIVSNESLKSMELLVKPGEVVDFDTPIMKIYIK